MPHETHGLGSPDGCIVPTMPVTDSSPTVGGGHSAESTRLLPRQPLPHELVATDSSQAHQGLHMQLATDCNSVEDMRDDGHAAAAIASRRALVADLPTAVASPLPRQAIGAAEVATSCSC